MAKRKSLEIRHTENKQDNPSMPKKAEKNTLESTQPKSAFRMAIVLWGLPLVVFILIAIIKGMCG